MLISGGTQVRRGVRDQVFKTVRVVGPVEQEHPADCCKVFLNGGGERVGLSTDWSCVPVSVGLDCAFHDLGFLITRGFDFGSHFSGV